MSNVHNDIIRDSLHNELMSDRVEDLIDYVRDSNPKDYAILEKIICKAIDTKWKTWRLVMISTNKLTTIYNLWGEREHLHPLECAEAMSYDARLNKKQKIWIHRFIKIWQYADLKEYELRDLFDFSRKTRRLF